jgi:hypothetical protein
MESVYPRMSETFPEQIVRLRTASTVDHAQADRRALNPLQRDKFPDLSSPSLGICLCPPALKAAYATTSS